MCVIVCIYVCEIIGFDPSPYLRTTQQMTQMIWVMKQLGWRNLAILWTWEVQKNYSTRHWLLVSQGFGKAKDTGLWLINPICSMYGIFTNISTKNHPNVGKYTMHGAYGNQYRQAPTIHGSSWHSITTDKNQNGVMPQSFIVSRCVHVV